MNNKYVRTPKVVFSNWENEDRILTLLNIDHEMVNGQLTREWFEGETIDVWDQSKIDSLLLEIEKVHLLPTDNFSIHNWSLYDEFTSHLSINQINKFNNLKDKYKGINLVVSHNDINGENVLWNGKEIRLIDFEWTNLNHEYYDYVQFFISEGIILKYPLHDPIFQDILYLSLIYFILWTYAAPQEDKTKKLRSKYIKMVNVLYN